jgi:acetyltransferase EpsM
VSAPSALVVIGGGEHARVVIDIARSRPDLWTVVGFIDPQPRPETQRLGVVWLGDDERTRERLGGLGEPEFVLGIGKVDRDLRRARIAGEYDRRPVRWATLVHARAWVSDTARLGPGVVVSAAAVVNTGAIVGRHAIVNTGAVIEHDVLLGDDVHAGPGAVLGGGVVVGDGSVLGLGCRVRDHVRVGRGVVVGMGSVVVADVADGQTVMGVPARPAPAGPDA